MKKTIAWILALALIAATTVIATIAYLTDVDSEENVFTIGNIDIDLLEYERIDTETANDDAVVKVFDDDEGAGRNSLLPAVIENGFNYTPGDTYVDWTQDAVKWQQQNDEDGYTSPIWDPEKINNEVDKMVFLKNSGDYGAYVRIYFAFEAGAFTNFDDFREMIHLNLNETDDWKWEWIPFLATNDEGGKYFIAKATYKNELLPDDFTEISLSQIALDPTATNADVDAFGDTYEVFVNAQGIQSAGFKDPETALDEGFGRDIPFEKLTLVAGIDLKTALHNLNGDESKPITDKVATVTFGLNETYPNIVKDNVGTFTSVEQDTEVYTYYVPNATNAANYDIYVLADDTIYTPKISTELFKGMSALTKVDTTNMDVSRTENMSNMFRACSALNTLDVSNWDVRNVASFRHTFSECPSLTELDTALWRLTNATDMYAMFNSCANLTTLDVSEWGLNSAINLDFMFYKCPLLTELDVSKWQVGSVTSMASTFKGCHALTSLDISEWDVGNVTTFESFLSSSISQHGGMMLESIDVSKWDTSSATNMKWMFYGCEKITELDLHTWDVSKVTSMYHMFTDCFKLEKINFKGWNTESLTDMDGIFNTCTSLKVIDVSDFDTHNVTDMSQVFESCYALEEIIGLDKWDTSNVLYMVQMFSSNPGYNVSNHLKVLDLSSFDTSNVTRMDEMFQSSPDLVTIYVGDGWTTENVTDSTNMFKKCPAIVGEKGTTFDSTLFDMTYAHVDGGPANPGYFTYKAVPSTTPDQNQ